jgi:hypothetical protein
MYTSAFIVMTLELDSQLKLGHLKKCQLGKRFDIQGFPQVWWNAKGRISSTFKWNSYRELKFYNILNFWDKSANNKPYSN